MRVKLSLILSLTIQTFFYGMDNGTDDQIVENMEKHVTNENGMIRTKIFSEKSLSSMPPLKAFSIITKIDFSKNRINTLDWVHDLPNLMYLDGTANKIVSVEPLQESKKLQYIFLNANRIEDPTPLIIISNQLKDISLGLNPLNLEKLEVLLDTFKNLELTSERVAIVESLLINKYNRTLDKYSDKLNTIDDFTNNIEIKEAFETIKNDMEFYRQKDFKNSFASQLIQSIIERNGKIYGRKTTAMDQKSCRRVIEWRVEGDHPYIKAGLLIESQNYDTKKFQKILNKNPRIIYDQSDHFLQTLLHRAVSVSNEDAIKIILDRSDEINLHIKDINKMTPFAIALNMYRLDKSNDSIMQLFIPKLSKRTTSDILQNTSPVIRDETSRLLCCWLKVNNLNNL